MSAERDPGGISLNSNLHFINIKSTIRLIWYDQITLLDSGD
ncbi:3-hydroxyacyl-CoA dehydrogenase [Pluralibacter gergoviae]|nr:3-hydroxyacyl-CoA dehydrogenase [Pluralibacter gergoviae]OUQ92025.1 3-hydroxyacyl-CoA dehydrogenase [Pluralibacter gergoviae]PHH48819.1 3-hydroxyacyl-CoA dehydrogenase [Pluralibacter gergoviae]